MLAAKLVALLVCLALRSGTQAGSAELKSPVASSAEDSVLEPLRKLLDDARRARGAKDFSAARTHIRSAIERALSDLGAREDESAVRLIEQMALFAHDVGELAPAEKAWRRVLEVRLRTLPEDHFDLQGTRLDFAETLKALGDARGARVLQEQALDVLSRTLPDDHRQLTLARQNLAGTLYALDEMEGARALAEKVLEVRSRTLPEDDPDLQAARGNLAVMLKATGDLRGARVLQQQVLDAFSRILPEDHPRLQLARAHLANTARVLGDLAVARALQEQVLEVRVRTLPEDHPLVQRAREDLAGTIRELGELHGARALEEEVLAIRSRTLPDDHRDLHSAQESLADARVLPAPLGSERTQVASAVGSEAHAARGEGRARRAEVHDARLGRMGAHRRSAVNACVSRDGGKPRGNRTRVVALRVHRCMRRVNPVSGPS